MQRELATLIASDGVTASPAAQLITGTAAALTVTDWSVQWLDGQEGQLRCSTLTTYRRQMRRANEIIDTLPLAALTPPVFTAALAGLRKTKASD